MDTGSYRGLLVKRIPFEVDNPAYGKPIEPLAATAALRKARPEAAVLELYQGVALPDLKLTSYDGARDVYHGDGRGQEFNGSCTNSGTDLSYGTDLRHVLHLGGEARRAYVQYDLSMLPKDAKVLQAVLALHVEAVNRKEGLRYQVTALKKPWSEKSVSEFAAIGGPGRNAPLGTALAWEKPLAAGASDRHDAPLADGTIQQTGWQTIDITPAVQKWLSGEWANCGLVIEPVDAPLKYGAHDVRITASDYPVDPSRRPRLILAFDGAPAPVAAAVTEVNADLSAAAAAAKAQGKPLLVQVLSAESATCRQFVARTLDDPELAAHLAQHYVVARIDAARPEHAAFLKDHLVRHVPSTVMLMPDGSRRLLEPYEWDCPTGLMRSDFSAKGLYLKEVLATAKKEGPCD